MSKRKKKEKLLNICGVAFCFVLLIVFAADAIIRIKQGEVLGGMNHYWQPAGPIQQLVGVFALLVTGLIGLWYRFRRPKQTNKKGKLKGKKSG